MGKVIRLPAFSATMETAKISSWLVEVGDSVEKGQVLAEIETDKAVADLESPVQGVVQAIIVSAGDEDIDVDSPLIEIGSGEGSGAHDDTAESREEDEKQPPSPVPDTSAKKSGSDVKIKASPAARKAARTASVDLGKVDGTGPNGRVTKDDVLEYVESLNHQSSQKSDTSLRKAVARAMIAAKSSVPHFYAETDIIVDGLLEEKRRLKASGTNTTVTAHVIRAVATALSEIEELKYRWEDGEIRYKAECDIAVAIDVGEGVVAPVIRGADQMDVVAIGQRLSALTEAAKSKSLKQSAMGDASLTISNLGMFAIDRFYPIINLPEPLIVGIGRIRRSPCPDGDTIVLRNVITVTQSIDHRVIDGAVAGRFAEKLQGIIEGTNQ